MLKSDFSINPTCLNDFLELEHKNYQLKLHKIFNPSPITPSWHIEPGRRNCDMHILLVISGTGIYKLGPHEIKLKPGHLFLVSNDQDHSGYYKSGPLLYMYSLRFGLYDQKGQFMANHFNNPFGNMYHLDETLHYQWLFKQLYQAYFEDDIDGTHILLSQILYSLSKESISSNSNDYIKLVTDRILTDHGITTTVPMLAGEIGLSAKQLTRLFSKQHSITPHQFIIKTRMNYGKYLLEESSDAISDIALTLGYSDGFSFSKQFKKLVGQSPRTYRQKLQSNNNMS